MTLRTGKSGAYRYYHCSSANRGIGVCSGPSIPEKELDQAVLTSVRSKVLDQDHLADLIIGLQRRERTRAAAASQEVPTLQSRVSAAESAMQALWASIRVAPSLESDPLFQRSIERAADELKLARASLDEAVCASSHDDEVSDAAIAHFRGQMIDLLDSSNPSRTKVYLSSIVARVEVGEQDIRIEGYADDLRKAVGSSIDGAGGSGVPEVRRYVRRWRRERDSNPRYGFP